jgi:hypothetical protein
MNDLARPSLYGSYHGIQAVRKDQDGSIVADIVGPICESGDFLAKDREMPRFRQGDLIAFMTAGAYGFAMSSNYNSRPRVAEVMVKGDTFTVIRERKSGGFDKGKHPGFSLRWNVYSGQVSRQFLSRKEKFKPFGRTSHVQGSIVAIVTFQE